MIAPNYKDGSIVNLVSTIASSFGRRTKYKPLRLLPKIYSKNIILIVIDGLGYNYLMKSNGFLKKHVIGKITTVFPSTTAAAMPSFITGTAPKQHALTGWYVYLKELGIVSAILPFGPRIGGNFLMNPSLIIDAKPMDYKVKILTVTSNELINTLFTNFFHPTKRLGYNNLLQFVKNINKAMHSTSRRKFIFAYWPYFDALAHKYGLGNKTKKHLMQLDKAISKLKFKNTTIIITSDHGFVNAKKVIWVDDHPKLKEYLTLPLCGDARTAYCYVRPSKAKQFENYVRNKLSKYCTLYKSEDLVNKGMFGLFKPSPKLLDRIGDYVIIMKDRYVIKDLMLGQKKHAYKGYHSGVSEDEMYVPVIVVDS